MIAVGFKKVEEVRKLYFQGHFVFENGENSEIRTFF